MVDQAPMCLSISEGGIILAVASLAWNHSETGEQLFQGGKAVQSRLVLLGGKEFRSGEGTKEKRKASFSPPSSVSRAGKNHSKTGTKRL